MKMLIELSIYNKGIDRFDRVVWNKVQIVRINKQAHVDAK
jgi:hypothetical protein